MASRQGRMVVQWPPTPAATALSHLAGARLSPAVFLAAARPADPAGELLAAVLAEREEGP